MSEKNAIEVKNVSKTYKDFKLDGVSFAVQEGTIMGFVGENGAGKTTTLKSILDLVHYEVGEISILGQDARQLTPEIKSQISVVFDGSNLHETLHLKDIDQIMKHIYPNWESKLFYGYGKKFGLPEKKVIKEYSRGMKMKLSIAIALSHHSKILILDEATSGLDPMVRDEILDIFLDFIQDEGHTILVSSHIISDIEKIADYITFIHEGKVIFSERKDVLLEQHGKISCSKEALKEIPSQYILGIRENSFGAEVLIRDKKGFMRNNHKYMIDRVSIEDIMLFISKGRRSVLC